MTSGRLSTRHLIVFASSAGRERELASHAWILRTGISWLLQLVLGR